MHHTSLIILLVGAFVVAFIFGALAHRLRMSPLVGYLLAGVVVGPFTPGFVADQQLAPQLAEIGVILLMFGVGLHFSLRDLLEVKAIAVPGALLRIGFTMLIGWGFGHMLGWPAGAGIIFGLSLSVASTVVLLRSLEERRLMESEKGRIAIGWVIVEDVAMVLALVLIPAFADVLRGTGGEDTPSVVYVLTRVAIKMGAFLAFMFLIGRRVIPWILERVAGTGSRELFTLCVLAIALGVAFGSAEMFGVSFALGAFFAGMLLNESEFSHKAATETLPLRDAFAVLFFVSVGMLFDPWIIFERPMEVLATVFIIIVVKSFAVYSIARVMGKSNATALTITASLAQIGEFSFILAGLGLQLDLLTQDGQDLILAGALISIVINPLLFGWMHRREQRLADSEERSTVPKVEPPIPNDLSDHVILIGFGRVGSELGRLLVAQGISLVVIDRDEDLVRHSREAGLPSIRGNAANDIVLAEAHPERANTVMLAIPNVLEAGEIIATLRRVNPALTIVARAHSDNEVKHLLEHGADGAVMAERELAHSLAEMVMATPAFRGERHLPPASGAT
ncbi:YbaL family putative K(+) efflux transporter [Marilutibacter aestuarii]|uniref:Kef family K(+) transporter n=1 Tax=Marilutibacter aestuarii TaxID=1706195 RepID=A0A508A7Y6_9GAMM|nr:YbaL family putative K(+) efflux transporter [Lysobacter aestuarii]TQD43998.1 Kef family K(+) transporter [Lysobacter aestuarii]